jgi:hypothetical protein
VRAAAASLYKRPSACNPSDEGTNFMRLNTRRYIGVFVVATAIGITGGIAQAAGAPFFQNQGQDYSKNKRYQQGLHDGQVDQAHKLDHSKKRHFKKDDDQKAYEAGYQKGHGN